MPSLTTVYRCLMSRQSPSGILWHLRRERHRPPSRAWKSPRERERRPINGTYGARVPTSPDVRRRAFAAFVARCIARVKASRGWSVPIVAKQSGVGVNTLYRWLRGEWGKSPEGDLVEAFCDTVDVDPALAFRILWPGKQGRATATEPLPMEPEFEEVLRKLNSPNVSETEKYYIRETIRALASRPDKPARSR